MNIDAVINQLRTLAPDFRGNVAGAAAFANGIEDQAWLPLPAAYVVPASEDAEPNTSGGPALAQIVTERIDVIVVLNNALDPSDRRGQFSALQLPALRAAIFSAILNWRPDWDLTNPPTNRETMGYYYLGGSLIDFDRARLFWRFSFGLDTTITDLDGWQVPTTPLTDIQSTVTNPSTGTTLVQFDAPLV